MKHDLSAARPRPFWLTLVIAASLFAALTTTSGADTTGVWTGTVAYVNARHLGVTGSNQTRDFLIESTTLFVEDGATVGRDRVRDGMRVDVYYTKSTFFGTTRATRVVIGSIRITVPHRTPGTKKDGVLATPSPSL